MCAAKARCCAPSTEAQAVPHTSFRAAPNEATTAQASTRRPITVERSRRRTPTSAAKAASQDTSKATDGVPATVASAPLSHAPSKHAAVSAERPAVDPKVRRTTAQRAPTRPRAPTSLETRFSTARLSTTRTTAPTRRPPKSPTDVARRATL